MPVRQSGQPWTADDLAQARSRVRLSQVEFWGAIGVSQSSGSRYEIGALPTPEPVALLLDLTYGRSPFHVLANMRGVHVSDLMKAHGYAKER